MDDLISRTVAIEAFDDERVDRYYGDVSPESVIKVIESIPAVNAAPVVHGRWDLLITEHYGQRWQADASCSCCDFTKYNVWAGFFPDVSPGTAREITQSYAEKVKLPNYCESCGARMLNKND